MRRVREFPSSLGRDEAEEVEKRGSRDRELRKTGGRV